LYNYSFPCKLAPQLSSTNTPHRKHREKAPESSGTRDPPRTNKRNALETRASVSPDKKRPQSTPPPEPEGFIGPMDIDNEEASTDPVGDPNENPWKEVVRGRKPTTTLDSNRRG